MPGRGHAIISRAAALAGACALACAGSGAPQYDEPFGIRIEGHDVEVAVAVSHGADAAPLAPGLAQAFARALARCPDLSRAAREGRAGSLPFKVQHGKIVPGAPRGPSGACALDAIEGSPLAGAREGLQILALFRAPSNRSMPQEAGGR